MEIVKMVRKRPDSIVLAVIVAVIVMFFVSLALNIWIVGLW